jgi:zinc protease
LHGNNLSAFEKFSILNKNSFDSTEVFELADITIDSAANIAFAKEVLNKYIAAIGGEENLIRINDRITTLKGNVEGIKATVIFLQKSPNKLLQRIIVGDVEQKIIYNGSNGMKVIGEITEEIRENELVKLSYDAIMNLVLDPELYNVKLEYKGTEIIGGKNVYKVLLTLPNGAEWIQYYDVQSGWKLRDVKDIIAPNGVYKQITDFSDFHEVEGVIYPFKIEQTLGNQKLDFNVESIQINTGLAEANFLID